jgi:hypothetical protein
MVVLMLILLLVSASEQGVGLNIEAEMCACHSLDFPSRAYIFVHRSMSRQSLGDVTFYQVGQHACSSRCKLRARGRSRAVHFAGRQVANLFLTRIAFILPIPTIIAMRWQENIGKQTGSDLFLRFCPPCCCWRPLPGE